MRKLERTIEGKVVLWAERQGLLYTKLNLQGRRGWPDRVFWPEGGRPVLMEFKLPGEELDPMQRHVHELLTKKGYDVCKFDDAGKAIAYLRKRIV